MMEICDRCFLRYRPECKPEYFMQLKMTYKCEHFYHPVRYAERLFIHNNPRVSLHILRKICEPETVSESYQTLLDKYLKENPNELPIGSIENF